MAVLTPAQKRRMNEHLAAPAREASSGGADELVAFFCECVRPTCHGALWISVREFQEATAGADRWLVAPGHEVPSAGDEVVEARGAYRVVRMPQERADGA